jgi:hypothetical protein
MPMQAQKGSKYKALLINFWAKWGGWSKPRPGRFTSGKTKYQLYRRLSGPQSRSGRVRKISPTTGIRSPERPARSESLPYSKMQLCNKIHSHVLNLFLREHLNTAVSSWSTFSLCEVFYETAATFKQTKCGGDINIRSNITDSFACKVLFTKNKKTLRPKYSHKSEGWLE